MIISTPVTNRQNLVERFCVHQQYFNDLFIILLNTFYPSMRLRQAQPQHQRKLYTFYFTPLNTASPRHSHK